MVIGVGLRSRSGIRYDMVADFTVLSDCLTALRPDRIVLRIWRSRPRIFATRFARSGPVAQLDRATVS